MNSLVLEKFENYLQITINRPQALNALNAEVFSELDAVFSNSFDNDIHLVVIRGSGEKAFAAGADITEFMSFSPHQAKELSQRGQVIFQKIQNSDTPILAMIHGYALGGGLELALACHMRLVTEKAVLGLPELNLGLIPGYGGTQRMPQLIGKGKAIYHTLTSENLNANQALEAGLVEFMVEDVPAAETFISEFAKKLSRKSKVAVKLALEAIRQSDEKNGFDTESENFKRAFQTQDMKEGVSAFLEKRKPAFSHQ
jgi:enoyl-CoA hydratase